VNHGASGQIFPQPIVRTIADSTGLLDAHLGPDFAIVFDELALSWDIGVLGAALEVPIRFVGIAQNLGTRQYASRTVDLFREVDDVLRSWMSSHGIHAVVVRPDRQVYGAASAMSGLIDIYDDLVESLHI
jgi:3-(3-hydroxy-phenyl)propionate hydroxylase